MSTRPTLRARHTASSLAWSSSGSFLPGWDPCEIPFADPCIGLPQDLLHLFPDGLLRSEGAWLIYTLAKLGLKVDSINQAIASYSGWPPDVRIPLLKDKLTEGKEGGVPDSSSTLRMSGSEVMHFSLHR